MQNNASFCAFATFAREISGSILPPQAPNPPVSGANAANQFWKVSQKGGQNSKFRKLQKSTSRHFRNTCCVQIWSHSD